MLITRSVIKCAFFHSEEIGCIGSSQADMDWFKDVGYCFQGDRRGNSDFINSISGTLFSKAFSKKIKPILSHHGYKETSGSITDVGQLAENGIGVCVANMSCGYYSPHSDDEVVIFDDANNCLTMVDRLIDELGNNAYGFQYVSSYSNYNWGDFNGASKDYWYGGYGTANQEVVVSEETGEPSCYYCGCQELLDSQYGKEYLFCPDCLSDINGNEQSLEDLGGSKDDCIDDVDNTEDLDYDGSEKHKSMVNEYINKWAKNKIL
tara:strand:- start:242 stop:1030 length:789 start_codon:yes stop_codon:yes gene_type:complete